MFEICLKAGLEAALCRLESPDIKVIQRSRWYRSAPVPAAAQPDYVNGVAQLETRFSAPTLMALLLEIEVEFGRKRSVPNAARVLDLDIIDFDYANQGLDIVNSSLPIMQKYGFYNATALNHFLLANAARNIIDENKEVIFAGEISDGAHNFGFSQYASIFHPLVV